MFAALSRIPMLNRMSLSAKVILAVASIFLVVISVMTTYNAIHEKDRLLELVESQTKDLTTVYFDSLNTMMLTGSMDQRELLIRKMMARPNVVEARVIRGEPVKQQYGPGLPAEQAVDELDYQALKGDEVIKRHSVAGKDVLTVITPFIATENTRGVNCLQCHTVASGSVNGAVRISYSLAGINEAIHDEIWLSIIGNLIFFGIGMFLVKMVLKQWITTPLGHLMDVVTKRSEGDKDIRAALETADEIGRLGLAFNNMADNVNAVTDREHEAAEDLQAKVDQLLGTLKKVTDGDFDVEVPFSGEDAIGELAGSLGTMITFIRTSIDEKHEAMDLLQKKVDEILAVVSKAAEGDLTGSLDIDGDDAIAKLGQGVKSMVNNLSNLVAQVQRSGIQVASSATEIAATAKQHERMISDQASTTNDIAATATEISATAKELVNTMDEVSQVAESSASSAASGQEGLSRMEETMEQVVQAADTIASKLEVVNEKTSNISNVVTTITKVADQTNLLSLNAAIEAEKAGEYGLGFSVVATEIRRLADQTAVATLDIEQMVKEMQAAVSAGVMSMEKFSEQVRRSVEDVREVSSQLVHIIEQVQTLTPRFESVHQGMQFQSQGAQQINNAMMQLKEAAQHTFETLQQSNTAIEKLKDAANEQQSGVTKFKVHDNMA